MSVSLVIGPPGCGKTTHLTTRVRSCVEEGGRPLVCSLTRTAAAEAAGRGLPLERELVGTLHAHAYHALDRPELVVKHIGDWNEAHPGLALSTSGEDVDGVATVAEVGKTRGDGLSAGYHLARARMLDREAWPTDVRGFGDRWENWKREGGLLDFTDLIEQARALEPPGNPTMLLVDEAQDHSRLELECLRAWAKRAGALELVGDPWQALYTWRGAAPEMFSSAKVDAQHRLVLSQSYRVPRAVHAAATRWARRLSDWQRIDYAPRDADGAVHLWPDDWRAPPSIVNLAEDHLAAGRSVMLAAACDYMLWPLLAELRSRGLPFCNPWRSKRGDWNPLRRGRGSSMTDRLLALLKPLARPEDDADSFDFGHNESPAPTWTHADVHKFVDVLQAKGLLARGAKGELAGSKDSAVSSTVATLEDLEQWFAPSPEAVSLLTAVLEGRGNEQDLLAWWQRRLLAAKAKAAEFPLRVLRWHGRQALIDRPKLYVGTIHSFKGAEADTVILFPDLSPQGYAAWTQHGPGRDAVIRQFYVALTRAKETVYVCRPVGGMACDVWENVN